MEWFENRSVFLRMALIVKTDKPPNPANINLFRAAGKMFEPDNIAHLVKPFAFGLDGKRGVWSHDMRLGRRIFGNTIFQVPDFRQLTASAFSIYDIPRCLIIMLGVIITNQKSKESI